MRIAKTATAAGGQKGEKWGKSNPTEKTRRRYENRTKKFPYRNVFGEIARGNWLVVSVSFI
jgi:hypothetical protein